MEKIARFPCGEESVESCHVSACHGFFGPEFDTLRTIIRHQLLAASEWCTLAPLESGEVKVNADPSADKAKHTLDLAQVHTLLIVSRQN